MIPLKIILAAVDFSEYSRVALHYAAEFAGAFDSEVLLCNVVEAADILSQIPPGGEGYFPPNLSEIRKKKSQEECEKLLDESGITNGRVMVAAGKAFVEIIRIAREEDVDLIVVGTHGRGAVAHMLLGSVAEKVVRKAPCPVLTVHSGEHEFVMP
jgi:nucleotide-binding universal stress UspA family protein